MYKKSDCKRLENQLLHNIQNETIKQALTSYCQALTFFTPNNFPHQCREVAYRLGKLLYNEGYYEEALKAFEEAHKALEKIRGWTEKHVTKVELAKENADLYARLVHICLYLEREEDAFRYAVIGKGRALTDLLASMPIDIDNIADDNLQKLVKDAHDLKARQDYWRSKFINESSTQKGERGNQLEEIEQALRELYSEEDNLWETIHSNYPDYFATQSPPPLSIQEAKTLAQTLNATLVEFYQHKKEWVAFVILPSNSPIVTVPLKSLKNESLDQWTEIFSVHTESMRGEFDPETGSSIGLMTDSVDRIQVPLEYIYQAVLKPLFDKKIIKTNTSYPERLVLAPSGKLYYIPMAALGFYNPDTQKYRYLSEDYIISITPNLAALKRSQGIAVNNKKGDLIFAMAFPGQKDRQKGHYLPNVKEEVKSIFADKILIDQKATIQAAIRESPNYHVLHYACHSTFDRQNTHQSGLMLAEGWLRVRDILNEMRIPKATLVILSACNTGLAKLQKGDEITGFAQSFMYAGAPVIIASLWSIEDESTRYLFENFYKSYRSGESIAEALQRAQNALRETKIYENPYFWAGFQAFGAAYNP